MASNHQPIDTYPWAKILPRWILGIVEVGLSIYIVINFHQVLGLVFCAAWILALFVMLPLLRCTKCYYYGKRCNTAWGLITKFMFPPGDQVYFQSAYGLTFIFWPLRIIPLGLGALTLLGDFKFNPQGLFLIYVGAMILHRLYYRAANCPVCRQKAVCPVYNPHILAPQMSDPNAT